jgi:hypothetical protein
MSVRLCPADRRRKDAPGVRTFKSPTAALLVHRQDCLTQCSHGAFARTNDAVPLGCCPERRLAVTSRHDGTVPARAYKSSVPRGGMTRRNTPERCLVRAAGRARTALPASWTNAAGRSMYQDRVNMDAVGERLGTKGRKATATKHVTCWSGTASSRRHHDPQQQWRREGRRAPKLSAARPTLHRQGRHVFRGVGPRVGPSQLREHRCAGAVELLTNDDVGTRAELRAPRSQQAASLRAGGRGPPR